jgi:hypothetical protein
LTSGYFNDGRGERKESLLLILIGVSDGPARTTNVEQAPDDIGASGVVALAGSHAAEHRPIRPRLAIFLLAEAVMEGRKGLLGSLFTRLTPRLERADA